MGVLYECLLRGEGLSHGRVLKTVRGIWNRHSKKSHF
jgi:hypothetical protein